MNSIQKEKRKSILDCINYDLTNFFYDDYNEIDSEETPATFMVVYEKNLGIKEFEIFDTIQFRIFFDKDKLTDSNPVNVKFINSENVSTSKKLEGIVATIISIYGEDDNRKGDWDDEDEKAFVDQSFRRVWTIEKGESFISVECLNDQGVTLSILFFNNLIELTGKRLQLS